MTNQSSRFSEVPQAEIPRSAFNRSFGHKTTFDAGRLIPFFIDEALPGDTFTVRSAGFMRMATPIYPIMDNMHVDTHYFAVPKRLLWENFHKFMGEVEDPQNPDPTDYLIPRAIIDAPLEPGDIGDHMGLPIGIDFENGTQEPLPISALFGRAYRFIWNEWYRDQNLQNPLPWNKDDGPDTFPMYETKPAVRGKRHDYFTSCLPWPQKGPEVGIELTGNAPVVIDDRDGAFGANATPKFRSVGISSPTDGPLVKASGGTEVTFPSGTGANNLAWWEVGGLSADIGGGAAVTINQLREAFQIQKLYERDARGGTRYTELVRAHFGVISPDARLQRPEYLGGGTAVVNISPIHQTADTEDRPLGDLSAIGTCSFSGHGFTASFTEHTIVMGLISVRADQNYQQGIPRMFSRQEKFDFYWPALAFLGEQEVLAKEIFVDSLANNERVFGYQERFAEYRYKPNIISGLFRSDAPESLDAWHLAEDFAELPVLNESFIRHVPPIDRVIAVPSEPHFIADFWHTFQCVRPMPMYGVPGNIDRF